MKTEDRWIKLGARNRVRALEKAYLDNAPVLSLDEAIQQIEQGYGKKLTARMREQFIEGWARGGVTWSAQSLYDMLDVLNADELNQLTSALSPVIAKYNAIIGGRSIQSPRIVCLCGSTRFSDAFRAANLRETLAGNIVLTIGCDMRSDAEVFAGYSEEQLAEVKKKLDELHLRKIDMADEVLILNVDGYIGESTRRELAYARAHGKTVRWLEEHKAE